MASTVTTPSRPLPSSAGIISQHRRRCYCCCSCRPAAVLALAGGGAAAKPRRRRSSPAASTSCAALKSPEKQSTAAAAAKVPPRRPARRSATPAPEEAAAAGASTDYGEVAAVLETLYQLSPTVVEEDEEESSIKEAEKKKQKQRRKTKTLPAMKTTVVVRSRRRGRRMDLGKRVEMREAAAGGKLGGDDEAAEFEEALLREHGVSTDMGGLDWRRTKIPPVLSAAHSSRLFKLMQPMKAIFQVKENLESELGREPTDAELGAAMNMAVPRLRRHRDVGRAARNKLIKHNLRLVLYAINRYYPDMAGGGDGGKFEEVCQAGANGLITAIDRFEPRRGFRLSTYALFWVRHSISRAMAALSSFTHFPFAMESERREIGKAREELAWELGRAPTDEETMRKAGVSPARYRDVARMSRPAGSLHARNRVTQEELINEVTDAEAVGAADTHRHSNRLLRLAIDDLLDSLKPKESVVMRQRFGLDGRGRRTLSEIAGNLRISREMVRKYELKALMKLKHPTRVEYLRRYM